MEYTFWFLVGLAIPFLVVWMVGIEVVSLHTIRKVVPLTFFPRAVIASAFWPWDLYVSWGWRRAERENDDEQN